MQHLRTILIAASVLVASASPGNAQALARQIFVSVLTSDNVSVENLGVADFVVQEDGARREVLRVGIATDPRQVHVLVDTSAAAGPIIGDMRRALDRFFMELPPQDAVSLVTVGGARFVLVDTTTDRERVRRGLSEVVVRPETASYLVNALSDTVGDVQDWDTRRPVVVVVTTTGVDFSDLEPQGVTTALRRAGVTVHAVVMRTSRLRMTFTDRFGLATFPAWANRGRDAILDIAPEQTGGLRVDISTANGLGEVLSRLARLIRGQYVVTYASPESLVPARSVRVGVVSDENVTIRAVRVLPR